MAKTKRITVCAECLRASCWQGNYVCQKYMTADTVKKTIARLVKLNLEHECYWKTDEELGNQA